ncbi:unnamed protein product, partial [Brassica oleracea]
HHTLFFSSAATHYSHISSSVFSLYTFCSSSISTQSIYAGIFTSSSSAVSTAPTTPGSPPAPITPPGSPTLNPPSSSGPPSNPSSGGSGGPPRTPSLPSPPSSSSDGLSAGVVIGIAIGGVALLVRRNEEETKKMLTMFLLHHLLIWNVLAFLSRRTLRWTTATMAATKRNTTVTVSSCRDVTTTATHRITFYIGT